MGDHAVELLGILIALGLLIFLAFRGYTLLLAAPAAAIVAAAFSGEPHRATLYRKRAEASRIAPEVMVSPATGPPE
jgi:hypothetical protein